MFLGFANFYQQFIKAFSKIAILLTFLLKTIGLSLEKPPKATKKPKKEARNKFYNRVKIGRIKLARTKKLKKLTKVKNFAKFKFAKATFLPKVTFKTKSFLNLETKLVLI